MLKTKGFRGFYGKGTSGCARKKANPKDVGVEWLALQVVRAGHNQFDSAASSLGQLHTF